MIHRLLKSCSTNRWVLKLRYLSTKITQSGTNAKLRYKPRNIGQDTQWPQARRYPLTRAQSKRALINNLLWLARFRVRQSAGIWAKGRPSSSRPSLRQKRTWFLHGQNGPCIALRAVSTTRSVQSSYTLRIQLTLMISWLRSLVGWTRTSNLSAAWKCQVTRKSSKSTCVTTRPDRKSKTLRLARMRAPISSLMVSRAEENRSR